MADAIEAANVSFSYGKEPFIEGLTVSFPRGAVSGIIGPNGCGKSTVVKLACGMLRPRTGEVRVDGTPVLSLATKQRARRLAVLAQASRPPAMSVEALVTCGRYPYRTRGGGLSQEDRSCVEHALELAGVAQFRDHDVRCLSGGERQRAFIAMTLAQDTDLIVLDEPTTYLDVRACHEIMRLIRRLKETEGKTIVMVIHDLDVALRYCDRILVMQRGNAMACGSVEEVLALGAVERAFDVSIRPHETDEGKSYALFAN